jgi:hypothetical protein
MRSILLLSMLAAGCGNAYTYAGTDAATPDLAAPSTADLSMVTGDCDLVTQNCTDPAASKCAFVPTMDPSGMDAHACVAPSGTNMEGQPCTRASLGDDDCAKGLICTLRGVATGSFVCRQFCHADTDCPSMQRCTSISNTIPTDGLCTPLCNPFGNDCTGGLVCGVLDDLIGSTMNKVKLSFTCRSAGAGQPGDACAADADCAANEICDTQTTMACIALCDDTHLCPGSADGGDVDGGDAQSCQPLPSLTTGTCG